MSPGFSSIPRNGMGSIAMRGMLAAMLSRLGKRGDAMQEESASYEIDFDFDSDFDPDEEESECPVKHWNVTAHLTAFAL